LAARVRAMTGVKAVTPFVLQQALFTGPGGTAQGGLLRGVDFNAAGMAADIRSQLRIGDLTPLERGQPSILLGRELARNLGVVPGDVVTAISPQGAMTAVGMLPRMRRYRVAGTIEIGMYEYDSTTAYVALPVAREFAGLGDRVTGVEVKLDDPFAARRIGRAIATRLGWPFWVRDWMEMNKNLFAALQLEKLALFVIVTIIVLVAAFAIIGHLVLLVAEKRKEIGILKAIGAPGGSITTVFFSVGMTIGVVGTVAGSLVGLGLMWIQNTYRIIRLAGDVYQIDYLPMKLSGSDFALIVTATLAISFLATIFPARRAGALSPAEVLRYE
jgi:lipoprotein-releasing system permease protein